MNEALVAQNRSVKGTISITEKISDFKFLLSAFKCFYQPVHWFYLNKILLVLKVYCILMAKGLVPIVPYVMLCYDMLCDMS